MGIVSGNMQADRSFATRLSQKRFSEEKSPSMEAEIHLQKTPSFREEVPMAHVYVSFLGTNDYVPCFYRTASFSTPEPVRFVQEATVQLCCQNWGEEDRILIFTTEEAESKNWVDGGHVDRETKVPHEGLCTRLTKLGLRAPFRSIRIAPGHDSEQIWQQFDAVFEALNPGDRVVFDITHAFRSIPMLALIVIQYARVFKSIEVEGMYYGAFEVLGTAFEARNLPLEKRNAPILDLKPLTDLMDWTIATDRFLKGGDPAMIGELARRSVEPLLRESKGADMGAKAVQKLGKALESFSLALTTCRGLDISSAATELKEQVAACSQANLLPPFAKLFGRIQERVSGFSGNHVRDGLIAVRWCCEHGLIQQACTLLEELLFSAVLLEAFPDRPELIRNETMREVASQAFTIVNRKYEPERWTKTAQENREAVEKMISIIRSKEGLDRACGKLRELRNDINHAGYNNNAKALKRAAQFARELEEAILQVERIWMS